MLVIKLYIYDIDRNLKNKEFSTKQRKVAFIEIATTGLWLLMKVFYSALYLQIVLHKEGN